jgi:hypothetical protein
MNTRIQSITLANRISDLMDANRGEFTLTFYTGAPVNIKLFEINSSLGNNGFVCTLLTFTTNINDITEYDIYNIIAAN